MRKLQSNTRRELVYLVTEIGPNDQLVIRLLSDQIIVGQTFTLNSCIDACRLPPKFSYSFLYINGSKPFYTPDSLNLSPVSIL